MDYVLEEDIFSQQNGAKLASDSVDRGRTAHPSKPLSLL